MFLPILCLIPHSFTFPLAVTVSLDSTAYVVDEGDGILQVCVELISGTIERDVLVVVTPTNNDATLGE